MPNRRLIVTLLDGTTQEFKLISGNYSYTYDEWRYDVRDGLLRIIQGTDVTTFPLTSVLRWDIR
jgi:hypothetical protein